MMEAGRLDALGAAKLIAAALDLWLSPAEHPGPDPDAAAMWQALCEANLVDDARSAVLPLLREGRTIRPQAYIDVVESCVATPALLLELVDLALARAWPVIPYLASPCFALVDIGAEEALKAWIDARALPLRSTTDRWVLVAVLLTTTRMGDRDDLEEWFEDFELRDVPMWIVAAHLCARMQSNTSPADLEAEAKRALASARRDPTIGLPLAVLLVRHAQRGELGAFADLLARERDAVRWPPIAHNPLIAYINLAKHARAITVDDLRFDFAHYEGHTARGVLVEAAVQAARPRPPNWRAVLLVREPARWVESVGRLAAFLPRMAALAPGDPEVVPLYRAWQKEGPRAVPAFADAFEDLFRERVSFWARMKFNYF